MDHLTVRVARSVRSRGWTATASAAGKHLTDLYRYRYHVAGHLRVPLAMLSHPSDIPQWIRDRVTRSSPMDQRLPWIAMRCARFLHNSLRRGQKVLEYGGGGSTPFFLDLGCHLATVEHDEAWAEILTREVGGPWYLRFCTDPEDYVRQCEIGGPWDAILVDGIERLHCIEHSPAHLNSCGMLIVDNADHARLRHVPSMFQGWKHEVFSGLGVARSWVTRTDVYVKAEST